MIIGRICEAKMPAGKDPIIGVILTNPVLGEEDNWYISVLSEDKIKIIDVYYVIVRPEK